MTDNSIDVFFSFIHGTIQQHFKQSTSQSKKTNSFLLYPYAYSFSQIWYLWRNAAQKQEFGEWRRNVCRPVLLHTTITTSHETPFAVEGIAETVSLFLERRDGKRSEQVLEGGAAS
jgi:hypothetical protein